jgi:hypothetical protein
MVLDGLKIEPDGKIVYEEWKLDEIIFKCKDFFLILLSIELGFSF